MNLFIFSILGLVATLSASTTNAAGLLNLSRTELQISSNRPVDELYAENNGDTQLYLSIEQALLMDPGGANERLVPITDVDNPSLLVIPNRLVLAPGQKYRISLNVLRQPRENQIWRVTFLPRELIKFNPDESEPDSAPLFVSVGYGAVIYQFSEQSHPTE